LRIARNNTNNNNTGPGSIGGEGNNNVEPIAKVTLPPTPAVVVASTPAPTLVNGPTFLPTSEGESLFEGWESWGNTVPGAFVSISGDGKRLAAVNEHDLIIYQEVTTRDINNVIVSVSWQQLGNTIAIGTAADVSTADAVADNGGLQKSRLSKKPFELSADGSTVAIANAFHTSVYRYDASRDKWISFGQALHLPNVMDVALNRDGNRLALVTSSHQLRVHQYRSIAPGTGGAWTEMGQPMEHCKSIELSPGNGNVLVVGRPSGYIQALDYDASTNIWKPLDTGIAPWAPGKPDGTSLALDENSRFLAIGGDEQVRVLYYNAQLRDWQPAGSPIPTMTSGSYVSLSGDGKVLAIGGMGRVTLYGAIPAEWNGPGFAPPSAIRWVQVLEVVDGTGHVSVSLTRLGTKMAVSFGGGVMVYSQETPASDGTDEVLPPDVIADELPPTVDVPTQGDLPPPQSDVPPSGPRTWNLLGRAVPLQVLGSPAGDKHPQRMAISGNGQIVAMAFGDQIKVARFRNGGWHLDHARGGLVARDTQGVFAVDLDTLGNTLAYLSPGRAQVLHYDGQEWKLYGGGVIMADADSSLALSGDGSTLAVGSPSIQNEKGQVQVFRYNAQMTWWLVQTTKMGTTGGDLYGTSIALSENGNTMVVGSPGHSSAFANGGSVSAYHYGSNGWANFGETLFGDARYILYGHDVTLSSSGTYMAVGTPFSTYTHVYHWDVSNARWKRFGHAIAHHTIRGRSASAANMLPKTIAMSSDGLTLAIGVPAEKKVWILSQQGNAGEDDAWNVIGILEQPDEAGFGSATCMDTNGNHVAIGSVSTMQIYQSQ